MFGDVGQRLLGDAVQRETDRGRDAFGGSIAAQGDVEARPLEIRNEDGDVIDAGLGGGLRGSWS